MDRKHVARVVSTSPRRRSGSSQGLAAYAGAIMIALEASFAPALAAEPVTLDRALELAREHNPEILAAGKDLVVARGHLEKARYWNPFNPEIEGGAAQRRFDAGGSAVQPSAGISLEVEVAGQRAKRIDEAERNLARVDAEVETSSAGSSPAVAEAFYRVAYSLRRLELFTASAKH